MQALDASGVGLATVYHSRRDFTPHCPRTATGSSVAAGFAAIASVASCRGTPRTTLPIPLLCAACHTCEACAYEIPSWPSAYAKHVRCRTNILCGRAKHTCVKDHRPSTAIDTGGLGVVEVDLADGNRQSRVNGNAEPNASR